MVAGISPDSLGLEQVAEGLIFTGQPVDQIPGPTPIPTLTPEDVSALGENVTRQITVLIGRSTIPVLCGTSLQQPGTSYGVDLGYSSTAFQVDYTGANLRYYYDGRCSWCRPSYAAGQEWESIGAHYEPSPWRNDEMLDYAGEVQQILNARPWEQSGF